MDINQIMPLLSNLLNKGNNNLKETNNFPSNFYPDTTYDGKKIYEQNTNTNSTQQSMLSSLLPSLLSGGNIDISNLTNIFGKGENNLISTLFTPKNDKKTNPPKICEFVKVDDYEL